MKGQPKPMDEKRKPTIELGQLLDSGIMTAFGAYRVLYSGDRSYTFSFIGLQITSIERVGDWYFLKSPGFPGRGYKATRGTLLDYERHALQERPDHPAPEYLKEKREE